MKETLNHIRNRPRFKMYTDLSPEDCEKNLRAYLDIHKDEFCGNINREVATIFVKTNENNYWKIIFESILKEDCLENKFGLNLKKILLIYYLIMCNLFH